LRKPRAVFRKHADARRTALAIRATLDFRGESRAPPSMRSRHQQESERW
jgi:hypothetical protein